MEILVKSRYFFEEIKGTPEEAQLFSRYRVISINSVRIPEEPPFSEQYWRADNVLILKFDDVEEMRECSNAGMRECEMQQRGQAMTEADADAVARFAGDGRDSRYGGVAGMDERPIMIHCTAGISRSGAIGAALNEYYNKVRSQNEADHEAFWSRHPNINPNLHVLRLLWKKLKL